MVEQMEMEQAAALASAAAPSAAGDDGEWAIVEVMGHRRHAGYVRDVERFGAKLLRIDIYQGDAKEPRETVFYSGSALFSLRATDEATARRISAPYSPPTPTLLSLRDDFGDDAGNEEDAT